MKEVWTACSHWRKTKNIGLLLSVQIIKWISDGEHLPLIRRTKEPQLLNSSLSGVTAAKATSEYMGT